MTPALQAALLMIASTAVTAIQNVVIRLLSDGAIHPFEIAFFRSSFGFAAIAAIVLVSARAWPRTAALPQLGASSLFHLAAMLCFFYGLSVMPLAEAASLTFAQPLFGSLAAAIFLGEKVHARRWVAILVGLLGVMVVLRPGVVPIGLGPALVLLSTVAFAGVTVLVKRMSASEATMTVVFYQSLFMTFLTLPPAAAVWTTPSLPQLGLLVALGLMSTIGWLLFTRAFALADASALLPLEFVRLPLVAVLGYLLFAETPDIWVWIGAAIIFGSSLSIAHRENAAARKNRAR